MGNIAKQIDPKRELDLPDKPPGMHWSSYHRPFERFEHQNRPPGEDGRIIQKLTESIIAQPSYSGP